MLKHAGNVIFCFFLVIVIFFSNGCSSKSDKNNSGGGIPTGEDAPTNLDHLASLNSLGIDTNDVNPIKDIDGTLVPAEWNPLGKKFGRFDAKKELFYGGIYKNNSYNGLHDDSTGNYKKLYSIENDAEWALLKQKESVSADIDGDGFDEIILIYVMSGSSDTFKLQVIDRDSSGTYTTVSKTIHTAPHFNVPALYFFPVNSFEAFRQKELKVVKGDFDNDDKDEILVAYGQYLYVFDDQSASFALLESKEITERSTIYPFSIAAGNLDKDPADEFIVTYARSNGRGYYSIYDSSLNSPVTGHENIQLITEADTESISIQLGFSTVAIGDFDGDKLNEIAFCGVDVANSATMLYLMVMDDFRKNFGWTNSFRYDLAYPKLLNSTIYYPTFSQYIKALDYDDDNIDEIIFGNAVWKNIITDGPNDPKKFDIEFGNVNYMPYAVDTGNIYFDPDKPGSEEIAGVFVYFDSKLGFTFVKSIFVFGRVDDTDLFLGNLSTFDSSSFFLYPVVSLGDVDNDSPVLKYLNSHEILFTDPIVLSVLASPPYWEGIGQSLDSMSTYIGSSYGTTATDTNHLGFSLGVSVGFEVEVSLLVIKLGSIKTTAELESSLDWSFSNSYTVTADIAYNTVAGEDRVIFIAVPYDVYYYEIISDEDPAAVGTNVTINMPLGKQTLSVTRDFYNANNGIFPDIDSSVFQHTIGNPRSYPDRNAMLSIVGTAENSFNTISNALPNGVITVPQGSGNTEIGISVEDAVTEGFSVDASLTVSVEAVAAGVVAGASAGFNYGYSYDITTVNGTTYGGVIGGIPSEYFNANYIYNTGLFVYVKELNGKKFPVVNYWVE